ncbi:MAG: MBL fold metallo-hydrolase RNA specificity domain-containing protein [Calditrichia bacterium]
MAHITFLGAAGTVTGSRHLLDLDDQRVLIDCGLFQGRKKNRLKNWDKFPVPPESIDTLLLTHAHIDHTGYLPRLFRDGFSGSIHCTYPTQDLCNILLPDSAHIQEEDARWANKKGYSKHKPALPLYTVADARKALSHFQPLHYGDNLDLGDYRAKYRDAGHILGSAHIDIKHRTSGRKILFSGDLGRPSKPILKDPVQAFNVDYLVLESTYGNRLHPTVDAKAELAKVVNASIDNGGVLLIPAFSVGRTQTILYVLRELEAEKKIPALPVYVDSPMAIDATKIFNDRISDQNLTSRVLTIEGKEIFRPQKLKICKSRQESKSINNDDGPAIIISASGMATGGRILHHLVQRLPDPKNTVLFMGYQATGTRGRTLLDGMDKVKIHGRYIPAKAKIENFCAYSGHADYNEILAWLMAFNKPPEKTFLVHGEPDAAESMAGKIRERYGWDVVVAAEGARYELNL